MPTLFDPLTIGDLTIPNRIVMAPLTRSRASEGRVPNDLMRQYYAQRASAGLILSEATSIVPRGVGYKDTPGLWSPEQVAGWKAITQSVHDAGGRIFAQLWHVGRISHPDFLGGQATVSSSAKAPEGEVRTPSGEKVPYTIPHALTPREIAETIAAYKTAAQNAQDAGFDGVEIHGANGYLPDQFLRDGVNNRTDEYGGPIENRARFLLEATDAAVSVWGAGRVGVHLSPRSMSPSGPDDSDIGATFGYAARELGKRNLAFLFVREKADDNFRYGLDMKKQFGGPYIANENIGYAQAQELLDKNEADAVSWGRQFIANPDLPERIKRGGPFNEPNPATFYFNGATGYTDYPALEK